MLGNPKLVVRAWRKRCYIFASATIFDNVCREIKLWLNPHDDEEAIAMELFGDLDDDDAHVGPPPTHEAHVGSLPTQHDPPEGAVGPSVVHDFGR